MLKTITTLLASVLAFTLFAQNQNIPQALESYLKDNLSRLGLTDTDLSYSVSSHYASTHTGVEHIYLQQRHQGLPIRGAVLNANLSPDGEVLSVGNKFVSDIRAKAIEAEPIVASREVLAYVLSMFGPTVDGQRVRPAEVQRIKITDQDAHSVTFAPSNLALESIRMWHEWMEDGKKLRRVWAVEYHSIDAQHVWLIRIDPYELDLIDFEDQVLHCQFSCAENHQHIESEFNSEGTPLLLGGVGGGRTSAGSHHTHQAETSNLLSSTPNSYNVFPYPVESPNHGVTAVVVDPIDELSSPFGWHDTNAVDGAEFTTTRGNNVHAYHDIFNLRRSLGDEPDGGTDLNFDFPYDGSLRPHQQVDAAMTNLFYWNNISHDILYRYGFDEAAGNFQATNYTGVPDSQANDWVRAEALDGAGLNNANFFAPPDGGLGRMQMFIWNSSFPTTHRFSMEVSGVDSLAGTYGYRPANFGPLLLPQDGQQIFELAIAEDTTNISGDGCDSLLNPDELLGKAAIVRRSGECSNFTKALQVQAAGATLVVICNTDGGDDFYNPFTTFADDSLTIPVIGLSQAVCDSLIVGLDAGISLKLPTDIVLPDPGPPGLDSDYDNLVIVHEYAHGLTQRLTGGPFLTDCLNEIEQAGEGWSDFFGLVFTTDSTNTPDEPRGIATWLNEEPTDGTGIRPFPFSRDFGVDPITYENFGQVSIPHGIGSIFGSALWDLYWNMADEYGFDNDLYEGTGGNNLALQLIIDGLKLQPCDPNFLESRDAIILADSILTGGENRCMIWETFARRGLGVNATPGGGADFSAPFTCRPFLQVTKTSPVDEELSGFELQYALDIRNGRMEPILNAVVYDTLPPGTSLVPGSSSCQITETDGVLTIELGDMAPESIVLCSYRLTTEPTLFSELDFEEDTGNFSDWDRDNTIGGENWRFRNSFDFSGNRAFFAPNSDTLGDFTLTMEDAYVLGDVRPGIILDHFYRTDEGSDGGVVEVSTDDGLNWQDVGAENFVENGYNPVPLKSDTDNPIAGRFAFHGRLDTFVRTALDLSEFAGQSVKLRFRFASNSEGGGEGWVIDNIYYYDQLFVAVNEAVAITDDVVDRSSVGVLMFQGPNSVEEPGAQLDMSIYPNPAQHEIFLQTSYQQPISNLNIRLIDLNGRVILTKAIGQLAGRQSINLGNLPAGAYLVDVIADEGVYRERLIIK
ncbi:MAG: M36 family metallopeptidase [Bacteroidota bacterium]